jgi:hypothetical protein
MVPSLKLCEHTFQVIVRSAELSGSRNLGSSNLHDQKIILKKELPHDVMCSTLLHEVMHMVADLNSIELGEQDIDNLAIGMLSLIRNNKELIDYISKEVV